MSEVAVDVDSSPSRPHCASAPHPLCEAMFRAMWRAGWCVRRSTWTTTSHLAAAAPVLGYSLGAQGNFTRPPRKVIADHVEVRIRRRA